MGYNDTVEEVGAYNSTQCAQGNAPDAVHKYSMCDLSDTHQIFVREYMKCKNAAESSRRAGYARKGAGSQGARVMRRDDVRSVIDQLMHGENPDLDQEGLSEAEYDALLVTLCKGKGQNAMQAMKLYGERRGYISKASEEAVDLPVPFASEGGE